MSWERVKAAYRALDEAEANAASRLWRDFTALVASLPTPLHLRLMMREIRRYEEARGAPVLLDHGCGGGLSVLYWRALGYDCRGVDIDGGARFARLNAVLGGEVLHVYDGRRLPLADQSIDIVFSQQVLEHVSDALIEAYYAEEGRVLKPGGLALHQVPHRLVPFDSHTKTWLVHWLPAPLRKAAYRMLGHGTRTFVRYRTPWFHRARARRHIGSYRDLTRDRLALSRDFDSDEAPIYDGNLALRRVLDRVVHAPVLGPVAGAIVRHLVMIDSVSVRR